MTKIEVSAARKNELMDSCQNGNLQEKLSAIRELMHYPDDDVKMLIKNIAINDKSERVRHVACNIGHSLGIKYKGKLIAPKLVEKKHPQLKLKTLINADKMKTMIETVYQRIIDENISYDNYSAFKTFARILEKEYPSEFMILSDRFTQQPHGMRNYFERNIVYHDLFITVDKSIDLQEKAFYVFDIKHVGHRLKGLKFRQLDLCKKQFRRDFPTEWEQVRAQCGGAVCSKKKTDDWVQAQYRLYKKQKDTEVANTKKSSTPNT